VFLCKSNERVHFHAMLGRS